MMRWLTAYFATALTMVAMDFVWLTLTNDFYQQHMAGLLLEKPHMLPAVLFYLTYVAGVVTFVVTPALRKGSWRQAAGPGALYGLVAYATYDLTNLATLKGFPVVLAEVDLTWGLIITAVSATAGYAVSRRFG